MPLYAWEDSKSGKRVEVLRTFAEYENPPVREEALDMTNEEFEAAQWERQIYGTQRVIHGRNWGPYGSGPGKGRWVMLLGALGAALTNVIRYI